MKLLIILIFLIPFSLVGQNSKPYVQTMEKFKMFYNAAQGDSVNVMFGHGWDEMKKSGPIWTNGEFKQYLEEYGKLVSFKFIGVVNDESKRMAVFKTVFSKKGNKVTSFSLDEENKLATFRFSTGSDSKEINKLLKSSH